MADTGKREELIDGLVEVLIEMTSYTNRNIDEITADPNQVTYGDWAERLISVFEQAHTPTAHPAHSGHKYGGGYARAAALAAGDPDWMNATGGTPTDDEREALEDVIWGALEPRLEDVINLDLNVPADNAVFAILVGQVVDAVTAGFRRTVQGEPTDAQVLAALNAEQAHDRQVNGMRPVVEESKSLDDWHSLNIERMRAVLRAALKEGECR